jgi:hypothetical protein
VYAAEWSRHACVKDGMHGVLRHAKSRFLRPGSDVGGGVVELESLESLTPHYCITTALLVQLVYEAFSYYRMGP